MSLVPDRLRSALADRYRIERELGAGGMATVYLAQDVKHARRVAVKVLKPELAAVMGAERFVQEITTTAALQHPHILPLFDSGSADGFLYYVMPFIDGETLREKLDREKQLSVDEAVRIARDVADALEHAHRAGVVHRDIKPENILLANGRPMVADFGIALAMSAAVDERMTKTGMTLGSPLYMSPEQATAEKQITSRSDVYSLASVLYEMLTGTPPHTGVSAQQIIMKIVTEEPPSISLLRKSVPANVAAAVRKALEKLPADRFESASVFAAALSNPSFRDTDTTTAVIRADRGGWRASVAVPALIASGVLLMALLWAMQRPAPPGPVEQYRVELPPEQALSSSLWSRLAVTPDGSALVYVNGDDGSTRLMVRLRDQLDAVALAGTEGAINPTISPDGKRVAFMDRVLGARIKVVPLAGGAPNTITDSLVGIPGLAWGYDGFIYYDQLGVGPLMRVPESGVGRAESVGRVDSARGELQHSWPDPLPNGKGVILTASHGGPGDMGGETDEIAVLDVATGVHRVLVRGVFGRYARSGHLVYVTSEGTLMGAPFDQDKMVLTGESVVLGEGVGVRTAGGAVDLTISGTGTLWYVSGPVGSSGTLEPVWVTRDGVASRVASDWIGLFADPAISPDGTRIAVSRVQQRSQIWVRDLKGGALSRLSAADQTNHNPAWSPDGRSVVYVSEQANRSTLSQRLADGSRPETLFLRETRPIGEVQFSGDGAWMIYRTGRTLGERDLYARRVGSDSSIALVTTPADETSPALSPDGRWLAYVSNESGTAEVYVRPFPNGDGRWQISAQGGQEPVWAPSGKELFYRVTGAANAQMVMDVTTGAVFVPGARRMLFSLSGYAVSSAHPQYAMSRDGSRLLMIRTVASERTEQLVVVHNFFEALRARR